MNSAKPKFDLHLSANTISPCTVAAVERLGMVRDEFVNNRLCEPSQYHGTFRGKEVLPNNAIWDGVCQALIDDPAFTGHLEEEACVKVEQLRPATSSENNILFAPMIFSDVPPGRHKACDIHLAILLSDWTDEAICRLECLRMVSFDKPTPEGTRRVFSVTCETVNDGLILYDVMKEIVELIGLPAKLKLESTTRYFRFPESAVGLPILTSASLHSWLCSTSFIGEEVEA